jgi:sugar lactone lactonase YvrE
VGENRRPLPEREINRFWNDLILREGNGPIAPETLDPTTIEIVRRLYHLGSTPAPVSSRERVRRGVQEHLRSQHASGKELPMNQTAVLPVSYPGVSPNGHFRGASARWTRRSASSGLGRWALSQLATAALLVLTLIAGLFAFGPWRPGFSILSPGQHLAAIIVATPEASAFAFLWRSTGGPDGLDQAYGLGIDPDGNVWVAEGNADRFQIIAPDGTYLETWGTPGSGDGEFEFLSAESAYDRAYGDIAFDAAGNLYVADTGNFRVQKFAPDRTFLRSWGSEGKGEGQFLAPSGIAIAADGVVYVSDETRGDVQMFDSDGKFLGVIGEKGNDDGQFGVPGGVTVDSAGDVWVADWNNRRIQRFTSAGVWRDTWGPPSGEDGALANPNDVGVDAQGRVYVVADFSNQLHAFTTDGRFLATIGGYGKGPGQFSDPLGIAVGADGVVYVSDMNGVQAFRLVLP